MEPWNCSAGTLTIAIPISHGGCPGESITKTAGVGQDCYGLRLFCSYIRTFLIWPGYVNLTGNFRPESLPSYITYKETPKGWCTIETMRNFRRTNNLTFTIIRKNRQSRRGAVRDLERKNQVRWAGCNAPREIFWDLTELFGDIGCRNRTAKGAKAQ
jgi:hypothetical protein